MSREVLVPKGEKQVSGCFGRSRAVTGTGNPPLLVTVVLGDVVKVCSRGEARALRQLELHLRLRRASAVCERRTFTTDDNGTGHLGRNDLAGEDATTDRDLSSEGALLVDVGAVDGLLGGLGRRGKHEH